MQARLSGWMREDTKRGRDLFQASWKPGGGSQNRGHRNVAHRIFQGWSFSKLIKVLYRGQIHSLRLTGKDSSLPKNGDAGLRERGICKELLISGSIFGNWYNMHLGYGTACS